jgi:hypothetical protein
LAPLFYIVEEQQKFLRLTALSAYFEEVSANFFAADWHLGAARVAANLQ